MEKNEDWISGYEGTEKPIVLGKREVECVYTHIYMCVYVYTHSFPPTILWYGVMVIKCSLGVLHLSFSFHWEIRKLGLRYLTFNLGGPMIAGTDTVQRKKQC